MKRLTIVITTILMLASCMKQEAMLSEENTARKDSLALHVAVMPVMDCLPIYYAQQTGIFDTLGIDVVLLEYASEMDVDTALIRGRAQLGYTGMPRLLMQQREGDTLHALALLPGKQYLITARTKRIRKLKQLNERLVALSRYSCEDYWSDRVMEEAGLEQAACYRPQINDIPLRYAMLCNQLVDAAFLPEPYASAAQQAGNGMIFETPDSTDRLACLATAVDKQPNAKDMELFLKGYNEAVNRLNNNPCTDSVRALFVRHFSLPAEVADSLSLPKLTPTRREDKLEPSETIKTWFDQRHKIK